MLNLILASLILIAIPMSMRAILWLLCSGASGLTQLWFWSIEQIARLVMAGRIAHHGDPFHGLRGEWVTNGDSIR